MVSVYLCDNVVTAAGSICHSLSEYGAEKSVFIALDKASERMLAGRDVKVVSVNLKVLSKTNVSRFVYRSKYLRFGALIQTFYKLLLFYRNLERCKKILWALNAEVVYASTDRSHGNGYILPFIKAALILDIRVVILDFADPADEQRLLKVRLNSEQAIVPNFLSKRVFGNWILRGEDGYEVLMYPVSQLLVWWVFGAKSDNPKFIGHLKGVAVEVRIPKTFERLRISGVQNITLCNNYMLNETELVDAEPIYDLALALPQLSEHELCSHVTAKKIHDDLIKCLKSSGLNFVILLHPKMDEEYYAEFLKVYNVQIFDGSSYSAIKLSRGLLSVYSSLTHDAYSWDKWVHVYDPLGLNYRMFECYPELEISTNIDMLSQALKIFRSEQTCLKMLE